VVVTVAGFIASLNVAVPLAFVATPVAPFAGVTELTVGGVVSGAEFTGVFMSDWISDWASARL
jgi:hypothetical protein